MENFIYNAPTKVYFGKKSILKLNEACIENETKKVLIVYGSNRIEKTGLLQEVKNIFDTNNIQHKEFSGVKANPTLTHAEIGVQLAKDFTPDLILAIGGGSCMDTAKAISVGMYSTEKLWDIWCGKVVAKKAANLACILTIAAAGSEMSNSGVLTNESTNQKRGLNIELFRCKFAIMDPSYTMSLPRHQIACGVADIMMHTLDRFFYPKEAQHNHLTDEIAYALLRNVISFGYKAYNNPNDYEAMSEIMWSSSISHNDLTGLGGGKDFSVHQFGHEISAMFDITHGDSLTAVWGSWCRYVLDKDVQRFVQLANNVWNIPGSDRKTAIDGIERMEDFFRSIDMPVSIGELRCGVVQKETISKLTLNCTRNSSRKIGVFMPLDDDGVFNVYEMANH